MFAASPTSSNNVLCFIVGIRLSRNTALPGTSSLYTNSTVCCTCYSENSSVCGVELQDGEGLPRLPGRQPGPVKLHHNPNPPPSVSSLFLRLGSHFTTQLIMPSVSITKHRVTPLCLKDWIVQLLEPWIIRFCRNDGGFL